MAVSPSVRLAALALSSFLVLAAPGCKKDTTPKGAEATEEPGALAEDGTDSASAETDASVEK